MGKFFCRSLLFPPPPTPPSHRYSTCCNHDQTTDAPALQYGPFVRPGFRRRLFQRTLNHAAAIDGRRRQGQFSLGRSFVTSSSLSLHISSHCQRSSWRQNPLCSSQCMKTLLMTNPNPNPKQKVFLSASSTTRATRCAGTIHYPSKS